MTSSIARQPVTPEDLRYSSRLAVEAMESLTDTQWNGKTVGLDWTRLRTAGHVLEAYGYCIVNAVNRSTRSISRIFRVPLDAKPSEITEALPLWAEVLLQAAVGMPEGTRGTHRWGKVDSEGYLAIGCVEALLHVYDVLEGISSSFEVPEPLTNRLISRLFPWVDADGDAWQRLLWATGRNELPGKPSMSGSWAWHCAPLEDWDGSTSAGGG